MTRLEEIKGRLERATPGKWFLRCMPGGAVNDCFVQAPRLSPRHPYDIEVAGDDCGSELYPAEMRRADMELLANSKADLAYLLARVEALQEVYEAAQEERRIEYGPKLREALKNASEVMG